MATDVHCHYVPEAYLRYLDAHAAELDSSWSWTSGEEAQLRVGTTTFRMGRDFVDHERHLSRMARGGIGRSVLSLATPLINYRVGGKTALEAARLINDELASLRAAYPDKLDAWAYLPMQEPQGAAAELVRAVLNLGLRGGHVGSNVNGEYLDDPRFAPVIDAAAALDVPLFIHPHNPPGRERLGKYELSVVAGYLFDTTLNIFNMIFGGLLDRYPDIRLCCTHAGGYAVMLRGRMQRELDTNRDLARKLKHPLAHYLRRLYYDTVCLDPDLLRFAVTAISADRFVLGSDSPFPLGDPDPVESVRRAFGETATAEKVLSGNAAALLGR